MSPVSGILTTPPASKTPVGVAPLPRSSMAVAAFSTVVEWYDFTLYLFMTAVMSRVFFGTGPSSVITTLAVFALAYVMRPLGALAFAHLGDRFGRRRVLLASMTWMTAAMTATAALPTRDQIGPAAGALLLLLRCVMGFSVGGEYAGVMTYLVEGAPPAHRGLVASLASAASEIGALLAVGAAAVTTASMKPARARHLGLAHPVPPRRTARHAAPWPHARRCASPLPSNNYDRPAPHPPARCAGPCGTTARPSTGRSPSPPWAPSRTTSALPTSRPTSPRPVVSVKETPCGCRPSPRPRSSPSRPWPSMLADRVGRRPALLLFGGLALTLPVAMFALMDDAHHARALTGAVVLALVAGGVSAVGASATPEQFPVTGRLSGLAVGTVATTVFGGLTPYLSQTLIDATGWSLVPGAMVTLVALTALPVLWYLPETAPHQQTERALHRP